MMDRGQGSLYLTHEVQFELNIERLQSIEI